MIRTNREYHESMRRLAQAQAAAGEQHAALLQTGMMRQDVEAAMEPTHTFLAGIQDEIGAYERTRRGEIAPIMSLADAGRTLIRLRIAAGLSQRELADRLGVDESQVSRDERNEYYGATLERAQRVLDVLNGEAGMAFTAHVSPTWTSSRPSPWPTAAVTGNRRGQNRRP